MRPQRHNPLPPASAPDSSLPAPPHEINDLQSVTYLCPICKRTEEIPTAVVIQFDLFDGGDPHFPPRFQCQHGCNVLMTPLQFTGHQGYTYLTDPKTGVCRVIPSPL